MIWKREFGNTKMLLTKKVLQIDIIAKSWFIYEVFGDIRYAIEREKQIKNWKRDWKNDLVSRDNPDWLDIDLRDCGSSPQ